MTTAGENRAYNLGKSLTHPCFNGCGGKNTRIHLPIAASCNIQCNYCVRKYSCVNESRPGVTARVINPPEAAERFLAFKKMFRHADVAGVAGPGDALAEFDKTEETFRRIRELDQDVTFCLSTNGLLLSRYAERIAALGVSHVTVTVNALDPGMGKRIYRFVSYNGKNYFGAEGSAILLENQYQGIAAIRELGIVCKVNIVMLKGINDRDIPGLVQRVKDAGADIANIMQLIPVKGSIFEHIPMVSNAELTETRGRCEAILPQMYHCRQCRADAAGTLDEDVSRVFAGAALPDSGACAAAPDTGAYTAAPDTGAYTAAGEEGPPRRFAAASKNGMMVDLHFGHAREFYIYEYRNGKVNFLEKRTTAQYCLDDAGCETGAVPAEVYKNRGNTVTGYAPPGNPADRHRNLINAAAEILKDCDGVIVMRIGHAPRLELENRGIRCFVTYNYTAEAVKEFAQSLVYRTAGPHQPGS